VRHWFSNSCTPKRLRVLSGRIGNHNLSRAAGTAASRAVMWPEKRVCARKSCERGRKVPQIRRDRFGVIPSVTRARSAVSLVNADDECVGRARDGIWCPLWFPTRGDAASPSLRWKSAKSAIGCRWVMLAGCDGLKIRVSVARFHF
jgi:hypothetical protein